MRGAVSLAAALALPLDFPERDLVIFLALCVIFATLVVQGLTLPLLIRALDGHDDGTRENEEVAARRAAAGAAVDRLNELLPQDWTRDTTVERMIAYYQFRLRRLAERAGEALDDGEEQAEARSVAYQRVVRETLEAQRVAVLGMRNRGEISDEVMHRIERELDLEDQRLDI
jgi:CPA1 family monovalent cation:H+ antiporter